MRDSDWGRGSSAYEISVGKGRASQPSMVFTPRPLAGLAGAVAGLSRGLMMAAGLFTAGSAAAQAFPDKPIALNSAQGPGTAYDQIFRVMQEDWKARTGKIFIFNAMPGGLGTMAPGSLLRAAPDGYTVGFSFAGPITLSPLTMNPPPYDPVKDFAPITQLSRHGLVYVAAPNFQANNFNELIALAKANPGKVSIGYSGPGSLVHILQITQETGAQFLAVPYKGATQLAPAVMGGEVNLTIATGGPLAALIKSGKLKGLFIGSRNRSPQLPDVPALPETHPALEGVSWFGLLAPAGTPRDRIDWLHREFTTSMKLPKVQEILTASSYDLVASTPEQFGEVIKRETAVYSKIVKQYNVKAE